MIRVRVHCDRCALWVDGAYSRGEGVTPGGTCGYYETGRLPWSRFASAGEEAVCDACMHKDPRYIYMYGDRRSRQTDHGEILGSGV